MQLIGLLHSQQVNALSQLIHGTKIVPDYHQPSTYRGELVEVE